ncbi:hypothetical protein Mapa_000681 [Marchantia paleacea]|nr:hypothetical protein Mapa_000681 [Marchantia paleacea]
MILAGLQREHPWGSAFLNPPLDSPLHCSLLSCSVRLLSGRCCSRALLQAPEPQSHTDSRETTGR